MNTPGEEVLPLPLAKDAASHGAARKEVVAAGSSLFDTIKIVRGELQPADAVSWRALEQTGLMTPFQRQDWLARWQVHCAATNHEEAVTALCYQDGHLMLVLPLSLWRSFGMRCLSWRAHTANDYCGPVVNPAFDGQLELKTITDLFRQIASRIGGVDIVYLPKQLSHVGGRPNPFILPRSEHYHVGTHAIALGDDWDAYYKAQRSAKSRRRLKEKHAALHRLGEVEFRIAESGAEKARIAAACLELKSQQLARLGHWDPFLDANLRRLIGSYAENEEGSRFWAVALDVNKEPAAMAFGFSDKEQWLLYQMAMASGPAAQHSPGTLLLHKLMQHCIALKVHRLDLSLGDESYKLEWCNEHGVLATSFLSLSIMGELSLTLLRARAAAHRLIASHPVAYEVGKKVKAGVAKWRRNRDGFSSRASQS